MDETIADETVTDKGAAENGEIHISSGVMGKENAAVLRRRFDDDGDNVIDAKELAKLVSEYGNKEKQVGYLQCGLGAAVPVIIILLLTSFASAWLAVSLHNDLEADNDTNQLRNSDTNKVVSTRNHNHACVIVPNPEFEQRYRALLKEQHHEQGHRDLRRFLEETPAFSIPSSDCVTKGWELLMQGDLGDSVEVITLAEDGQQTKSAIVSILSAELAPQRDNLRDRSRRLVQANQCKQTNGEQQNGPQTENGPQTPPDESPPPQTETPPDDGDTRSLTSSLTTDYYDGSEGFVELMQMVLLTTVMCHSFMFDLYCGGTATEDSAAVQDCGCTINLSSTNNDIPLFNGGLCFSERAMVELSDGSTKTMKHLEIGDMVRVKQQGSGGVEFQRVYSFGHKHDTAPAEFLQIHTSAEETDFGSVATPPLEISKVHLLFRHQESIPVPAELIQVGDLLVDGKDGKPKRVTKIQAVTRSGFYAPLTKDGTIVVDGVFASTYVALQEGQTHLQLGGGGMSTGLSFEFLQQLWLQPYYFYCTYLDPGMCRNETYEEEGYSFWVGVGMKKIIRTLFVSGPVWLQLLVVITLVPLLVVVYALTYIAMTAVAGPTPLWPLVLVLLGMTFKTQGQIAKR